MDPNTLVNDPNLQKAALALVAVAVLYYIYWLKQKRHRQTLAAHDEIRQMVNDLRRSAEYMDSRIQWTFQSGTDYEPLYHVNDMLSKMAERGDWDLAAFYGSHKAEWDEARDLLSSWAKKKPNYDSKDAFLRDVRHVENIIKRW
jgi:hypothetical protein